jgi:hypothetical protein
LIPLNGTRVDRGGNVASPECLVCFDMPGTILVLHEKTADSIIIDGLVALKDTLERLHCKTVEAVDIGGAMSLLQREPIDAIFATLSLDGGSIFSFIDIAQRQKILTMPITVIAMSRFLSHDVLLAAACSASGAQYLNVAQYRAGSAELLGEIKKHVGWVAIEISMADPTAVEA